jgi:hypothetical protein
MDSKYHNSPTQGNAIQASPQKAKNQWIPNIITPQLKEMRSKHHPKKAKNKASQLKGTQSKHHPQKPKMKHPNSKEIQLSIVHYQLSIVPRWRHHKILGHLVSLVIELVGVGLAGAEFGGFEDNLVFAEGVCVLVLPDFLAVGIKQPDLDHAGIGNLVGDDHIGTLHLGARERNPRIYRCRLMDDRLSFEAQSHQHKHGSASDCKENFFQFRCGFT